MATRYKNGRVPKDVLVHMGGEHWLPPATLRKWQALREDVKQNENVTLRITAGANAYRDYDNQVEAKREHGKNAAWPGTSSHGGTFGGKDAMAIDVDNWMAIGKSKFYSYARKHGFEVNHFDWEPWHIIDWEPWAEVPEPTPEPEPEEEEEEVKMKGAFYTRKSDGETVYMLFNELSGFWSLHTDVPGEYNNTLARNWETNSWSGITEGHALALQGNLDKVRKRI